MNVFIHEDNSGALVLAKTLPPQYTPKQILRNQDNLIREEIFKRDVQLRKIDSLEEDKGMVIPLTPHNSMY